MDDGDKDYFMGGSGLSPLLFRFGGDEVDLSRQPIKGNENDNPESGAIL